MCLIAPQQNHTDSPLCYTGGSPSGVTAFGSLRFASLRHPRGSSFNGVALFQFTETFLHSRMLFEIHLPFHIIFIISREIDHQKPVIHFRLHFETFGNLHPVKSIAFRHVDT